MRRVLVAVLAALALIVAGCGGHHGQRRYHTSVGTQAHSSTFGIPSRGLLRAARPVTGVATLEMFDTVTVGTVPSSARVVAGYTSGFWPTYFALVRRFGNARVKSIAINTSHHAMCLDVEPGDATPSQAVEWIRADIRAGFRKPCIYSNGGEWAQIRGYLNRAGIPRSAYFAWLAFWRYRPGLIVGYDAVQWTDHALNRNLDESTVTLAFAGLSKPKPTPRPVVLHCFGAHPQIHNATCVKRRAEVRAWSRARDSSRRVYVARRCDVLAQRDQWFSRQIRRHPHSSKVKRWRKAVRATRRAERQRSCGKFSQRAGFFAGRIAAVEKLG